MEIDNAALRLFIQGGNPPTSTWQDAKMKSYEVKYINKECMIGGIESNLQLKFMKASMLHGGSRYFFQVRDFQERAPPKLKTCFACVPMLVLTVTKVC